MKAAIITSSDSGYAGEREDKSGSVIQENFGSERLRSGAYHSFAG